MNNFVDRLGLASGFVASVRKYPDNPALHVNSTTYTYAELYGEALSVAAAILDSGGGRRGNDKADVHTKPAEFVALFTSGNASSYVGILGILCAGSGYVPLNPSFPSERNASMLLLSEATTLVVDDSTLGLLPDLLSGFDPSTEFDVVVVGECSLGNAPEVLPLCRFSCANDYVATVDADTFEHYNVDDDAKAYLLFTSGSTGTPKGIAVSHGNARAYASYLMDNFEFSSSDRVAQVFDLTFDASVHSIFSAWYSGATLYPTANLADRLNLAHFVQDNSITVWNSVPSVALLLKRFGLLGENALPTIKISFFCGEALPVHVAKSWYGATPNGRLYNLYGPTEATVTVSFYEFTEKDFLSEGGSNIVPIGKIIHTQDYRILDEHGADAEEGELLVSGSQVTDGYLKDPARTAESYVTLPESTALWYRTGDIVREDNSDNSNAGDRGVLHFVCRKDFQVKIQGYRVELEEVNHAISKATGEAEVYCVVPAVATPDDPSYIVAFVATTNPLVESRIIGKLRNTLPPYMLPRRIVALPNIPLNSNGKVDTKKLQQLGGSL